MIFLPTEKEQECPLFFPRQYFTAIYRGKIRVWKMKGPRWDASSQQYLSSVGNSWIKITSRIKVVLLPESRKLRWNRDVRAKSEGEGKSFSNLTDAESLNVADRFAGSLSHRNTRIGIILDCVNHGYVTIALWYMAYGILQNSKVLYT